MATRLALRRAAYQRAQAKADAARVRFIAEVARQSSLGRSDADIGRELGLSRDRIGKLLKRRTEEV